MATKNMGYDSPVYQAVMGLPTGQMNGASGVSTKYAAFTALTIKSVTLQATTAGTASDNVMVMKVSGTATTTTTYGTNGSGSTGGNFTPALAANQVSCLQNDIFFVQKGAEATGTYVGMIEYVVNPLANVTL